MTRPYPDISYLRNLALQVGHEMVRLFQKEEAIEWKPGESGIEGSNETPQTAADRAVNAFVLERLGNDFQDLDIMAEEGSRRVKRATYQATIDPIDGSFPWAARSPVVAFTIAILRDQMPIASVIYNPLCALPQMWSADELGSYLNGRRIRVSSHATFNRAGICMVWWGGCRYNMHKVAGRYMELGAKVSNPLSLAYYGGLVASGGLEAAMFPGNDMRETAAMHLIIEGAGGRVTNIAGEPIRYDEQDIGGSIVSNGVIHEELLRVIRECQE